MVLPELKQLSETERTLRFQVPEQCKNDELVIFDPVPDLLGLESCACESFAELAVC